MGDGTSRRLAAIVAADIVGFSRLMGADEVGTLSALRALRVDLVDPLIARHGGRIVKTTGDGLLLEFPSVVAAVECAIAIQTGVAARNEDIAPDRALRWRIGVHVGDIIIEGDDIFGDGVNIAARIEPLAAPDGVSLSDDAYRQVRDRLQIEWEDGGDHAAKNIARPIHLWHWAGHAPPPPAPSTASSGTDEPLELPDRPSIAVLPFDNLSGDPEQEYFADGMTEDLITDLSKISGMFVVARNSSFAFKGQAIDIRDAARRLGVRYVLEGSVRKAGQRIRINVQLIDAPSGGHLWAERYDGTVDNVFELQDEVGAKVISALEVRLRGDEQEHLEQVHTRNLDAYELYVRAKSTPYPPLPDRIEAARTMFEQVIEMDPDFAGGYAGLAWMLGFTALWGHEDPTETAERAEALARRAIEVDSSFGWGHMSLGLALHLQGRRDEALEAAEQSLLRQPGDADAHAHLGLILAFSGRSDDAREPLDQAIRLNPQFVNGPYLNLRSLIRLLSEDYAGSVESFEENVARGGPVGPPALAWAAAAYWAIGRHDDARSVLEQLHSRFPSFRLAGWNLLRLLGSDADRERLYDLMHAAGVPD